MKVTGPWVDYVHEGYRIVNGRPHGANYRERWRVEVYFDTADESREFLDEMKNRIELDAHPET